MPPPPPPPKDKSNPRTLGNQEKYIFGDLEVFKDLIESYKAITNSGSPG
jgi:hypothetical protein